MVTRHISCLFIIAVILGGTASNAEEVFDPESVLSLEPEAFDKEVWRLFEAKDYGKLSAIADRACETQATFPDGTWKLRRFYDGLMDVEHRRTALQDSVFFRTVFEWGGSTKYAEPKAVLQAREAIHSAWGQRGGGFAHEVDDWRMDRYTADMSGALKKIVNALRTKQSDPELYCCLLRVSLGSGVDRDEFMGYLQSAITRFPTYLPLYDAAIKWFAPAWHGEKGDLAMLADYCQTLTQERYGAALYFYVAQDVSMIGGADTALRIHGLEWARIREGYEDFARVHHVAPLYEETYFLYACISDDKAAAAESLKRLPSEYTPERMGRRGFEAWKKWVTGEGPRLVKTRLHEAAEESDAEYIRVAVSQGKDADPLDEVGRTPIDACATLQDWDSVRLLAEHGAAVNLDWKWAVSPLSHAAWAGDLEIAKFLIEHGARLDTEEYLGRTPLYYAVKNGNLETISLFLRQPDCDVNKRMGSASTPLYTASREGNRDVVELLLDHGADPHVALKTGSTPLHVAAWADRVEVVALFLQRGVYDVNVRDASDCTPLFWAASGGHLDIVRMLLAMKGCDVNARSDAGSTPLYAAASAKNLPVVELLVEHGADVNIASTEGFTPLVKALNEKDIKTAMYLLEHGADARITAVDGWNALMAAADANSLKVTEAVLAAGVDVNARQTDGWTAFHMATMNGQIDILKLLLDHPGAEQNPVTDSGETLMHRAARNGYPNIVRYLAERGMDINARDKSGKTPLDMAKSQNHPPVLSVLRELGATE
ncbi:MAG: ankyrin repeat domain-containing protein [Candidatus Hydrogenedentes bacterium]|nr:ankyrin repeat domain-containing protein [Candidatus Hydrogenedentota bacterium]